MTVFLKCTVAKGPAIYGSALVPSSLLYCVCINKTHLPQFVLLSPWAFLYINEKQPACHSQGTLIAITSTVSTILSNGAHNLSLCMAVTQFSHWNHWVRMPRVVPHKLFFTAYGLVNTKGRAVSLWLSVLG